MGACHIPLTIKKSSRRKVPIGNGFRASLVQIVSAVTLPTPLFKHSLFPPKKCGTGIVMENCILAIFQTEFVSQTRNLFFHNKSSQHPCWIF